MTDDGSSLLDVLREQLGHRSVKDGCSPQGQCGCCTVWVDGAARVACVTPARRVAGREVTTIEGLAPSLRDAWAEAFCDTGASQCGFCTPGQVVSATALLATNPHASREQIRAAMCGNLCRCGAYPKIELAILRAAAVSP